MKHLFDRAVSAGVRGPLTAQSLVHYHMADAPAVVGDPAVWFQPIRAAAPVAGRTVGVCIRSMRNEGPEERYANAKDTYDRFASVLAALLDRLDATPVFMSFAENEFDSDSAGADRLRKLLPTRYQSAPFFSYSDDVLANTSMLGAVDYVFSERMHPGIIAWVLGKPCVIIENQYRKSEDFMSGIGMERFCLRTNELTAERYMPLLVELLDNRVECDRVAQQHFAEQRKLQAAIVDTLLASAVGRS